MKRFVMVTLVCVSAGVTLTGCSAFRANVTEIDPDAKMHLKSTYDYSDMKILSADIAAELLKSQVIQSAEKPPVFIMGTLENRTQEHVDTKNITDRIRTLMQQSGKVLFVNETVRDALKNEQGYQAANATAATSVAIGKQVGARYMIAGAFTEMESNSPRQVRVSKAQVNSYKMTINIVDLETGLNLVPVEKEIRRQIDKPMIGW